MPVTARLSKAFYDRMGEQVANELVEWFNTVDSTYRSDLKELNELNFARFDAKLEQRLSHMEVHIERRLGEQSRWLYGALAVIFIGVMGLYTRR